MRVYVLEAIPISFSAGKWIITSKGQGGKKQTVKLAFSKQSLAKHACMLYSPIRKPDQRAHNSVVEHSFAKRENFKPGADMQQNQMERRGGRVLRWQSRLYSLRLQGWNYIVISSPTLTMPQMWKTSMACKKRLEYKLSP